MRGIWLIPALVGAVAVYAAIDDEAGFRNLLLLRGDLFVVHERIEGLRDEIAHLSQEADALETRAFGLERSIREELEYVRPGETLVRLPRVTERVAE